jgi:hypothetical protein
MIDERRKEVKEDNGGGPGHVLDFAIAFLGAKNGARTGI